MAEVAGNIPSPADLMWVPPPLSHACVNLAITVKLY